MKLQAIAARMIAFARQQPYAGDSIKPYQHDLSRGLTLTYFLDGEGRHHLSLTRSGVLPSKFEERICCRSFGVPEHAQRTEIMQEQARIVRYVWMEQAPLVKILWPAEAAVATIGGQWRRLADGRIEALYYTQEELALSIRLIQWLKEWEAARAGPPPLSGKAVPLL